MRFFFATRNKPLSTMAALSRGLRAVYVVPQDMPDAFAKAFERLESTPQPKTLAKSSREKKSA
jgi:hypothetical protein